VERVIGTMIELVHGLPGATFSDPVACGDYDNEAVARGRPPAALGKR
jgi:putative transposase